jgi:hypothetical protein
MTGEGEVSMNRASEQQVAVMKERHTSDNPSLQRRLVTTLRCALFFQDLFQVVVYQSLGALRYGSSHLLQAGCHGVLQSRVAVP